MRSCYYNKWYLNYIIITLKNLHSLQGCQRNIVATFNDGTIYHRISQLSNIMILMVHHTISRFAAFSLPGPFAPGSESANRTLANSLPGQFTPGPFAPWPFRSLELSFPGANAKWFGPFAPGNERFC